MTDTTLFRVTVSAAVALFIVLALGVWVADEQGWLYREAICRGGEYPVRYADDPTIGGRCVEGGERPPEGYDTYPPGQVPEHVDDLYPGVE